MTVVKTLVLCTANVCRSPMAAALLGRHVLSRGGDISVTSAGIIEVDLPVDPHSVQVMADVGLEISGHQPRMITRQIVADEQPDLVITMSRVELRHVVALDRDLWSRTFTLKELVRRASEHPGGSAGSIREWASALSADRRASDMVNDDPEDDIADPYGSGLAAVRQTAQTLDLLISALVEFMPLPR